MYVAKSKKVSQTDLHSNAQDREFSRGQKDERFKTSRCIPELLYNLKFEGVNTGCFDHALATFMFDNRTKQMCFCFGFSKALQSAVCLQAFLKLKLELF